MLVLGSTWDIAFESCDAHPARRQTSRASALARTTFMVQL
jgi:hypothetical protein